MIKRKIMIDKDLDIKVISIFIAIGLFITLFDMFTSNLKLTTSGLYIQSVDLFSLCEYLIIFLILGLMSASCIAFMSDIFWKNIENESTLVLNATNKTVTMSNKKKYYYQSNIILKNGDFITFKKYDNFIRVLDVKKRL